MRRNKSKRLDITTIEDKKNQQNDIDGLEKEEKVPPISYFSLFRYATGLDKCLITIGILCSIGTGVCQPLNTWVFGNLTGDIIKYAYLMMEYKRLNDTALYTDASDHLIQSIVHFSTYNTLIGLGMLLFTYISICTFNYSAVRQIFVIRKKFFSSILNQDITWYDLNTAGDFAVHMSEDLIKVEDGLGEKVCMFLHHQVAFISCIILAFIKGWELAFICLTSLPASMIAIGIITRVTSRLSQRATEAYGVAGAIAEQVFSSIQTVIAFGGQRDELNRYRKNLLSARDINIKRNLLFGIGFGLLWFCIYSSYALAFWYGVGLILDGSKNYDAATMITVFFSVMMGSMNFGISSPYLETFGVASGAGAKVFHTITTEPTINISKCRGQQPASIQGKIVFKDVHFHYPSRPQVPILRGLNLTINAGETVALVGNSGCGKSTCIQLMQRFYDAISGQIMIDDIDVRDLNLFWLRNRIGVVGQEPVLFRTTIAENIRYGGVNGASEEDVERAARKSNAHTFIKKHLPNGYDTLVGERGTLLSGGQKQRIAIARALVREPAILLLDEATSALDTNNEAKVQAALDSASKECTTTIIVAHRLSTIRNADKIVVLSNGQVVEQGRHAELMALQGAYYQLVTTQVAADDTIITSEDPNDKRKLCRTVSESSDSDQEDFISEEPEINQDDKKQQVSIFKIAKLNSPEWLQILVGCMGSIIMGAAMPLFAVLFGEIIGVLSDPDANKVRTETNRYCLYFVIAGIMAGLSTFFEIWCFGISGEQLTLRLRGIMFEAMLKQEMAWFSRKENGTGSLCTQLSTESALVQGATGQRFGTILQSLATIGLSIGLSMYYEYRLGLVALAFTPVILIATFLQARLMKQSKDQEKMEKANNLAVEAVTNIRTVASLNCEHLFECKYVEDLRPALKMVKRQIHMRAIVFALARSIMFFAFAVCTYYGGILIRDYNVFYADIFKVSQALIMGTVSIANALAFAPNFQKGLEASTRIFQLLNRQPTIADSTNGSSLNNSEEWKNVNILYSKVKFNYPSRRNVEVLKGLDLSVCHGKSVALVGPSGCGKTTIFQLLERFYDATDGMISVDGQDIRNVQLERLRFQIGLVSQEPVLFDRTIYENIAYGGTLSKADVMEAAKKANIHNFIISLPLGYDTKLGEKGLQLSGGEKQRVAIARALIRDPKILLLDEATSALDSESEKVVQETLEKAKEGRTSITIAHRLSTIQDADVICVINRGKVVESGTHLELLNHRGLYYHLHSTTTTTTTTKCL